MKSGKLWMMIVLLGFSSVFSALAQLSWEFPLPATLVEDKSGYLVLANKSNLLEEGFEPHDLTNLELRATGPGFLLRSAAAAALSEMFRAAEQESGFKLYIKSAYRSYSTQNTMYYNRMERNGKDDNVVAVAGSSDHQTGLGVDILNYEWTKKEGMTPAFGQTAEAQWLEENAARFGFILRYMPDKQDITGIIYEPWHYRFVGPEAAQYIMGKRLSLEEFDLSVDEAIASYENRGGNFKALCRELNAPPVPVKLSGQGEDEDAEVSILYQKIP